jgi:phosphatidylglycerol:prolipoprotein diacylglycerol transferase
MYPTLYHAFYDMFGADWPAMRLLNSFGFFVALAFIAASLTLSWELQRKAKLGLFTPQKRKIVIGEGPNWMDIAVNGLIGFIVGWKFIYLIANSGKLFADGETPQNHIFSSEGYWLIGLLVAVAFGGWRYWEYRKQQLPQPIEKEMDVYPHHLNGNITFMAAIFGILGAKFFHLLENPAEFKSFFEHPSFQDFVGGLTVYGGLIVGAAGVLIFAWRKKINLWHLMDSAAPGMILAYGIGRIGCQVSGDGDWGIANTAPKPGWLSWAPDWFWAYDYPHNVNVVGVPMFPCDPAYEPHCRHLVPSVFPTPVYETIAAVLIFILLWRLRKKIVIPGVIMSLYLIFNGIERFLIEKIRVNNKIDFMGIKITQAEVISVLFFITGLVMLWYVVRKFKKSNNSLTNNNMSPSTPTEQINQSE